MESSLFILTLVVAMLLLAGMRRVPEDMACTVHRFGRYARTLTPGLRWTIPFVDHIAHRVRLVGHEVTVPAPVAPAGMSRGAIYYQILDPQRTGHALDAVDALVEREARDGLSAVLLRAAHGAEASNDTDAVAAQLKRELNDRLAALGLRVTRCKLLNVDAA